MLLYNGCWAIEKLTETVITNYHIFWLYCDTQSKILTFDITLKGDTGVPNWTLGNGKITFPNVSMGLGDPGALEA